MTSDADNASSSSPDPTGDFEDTDMADRKDQSASSDGSPPQSSSKPASNSKDPLRPRRKKAKRACFACQRAHLTCSDERPCQRCIKRGLQNHCQDGVRKKAKYLHDTPAEALVPGVGGHFPHLNTSRAAISSTGSHPNNAGLNQVTGFYSPSQPSPYNMYTPGSMPPPMQENSAMGSFSNQPSPVSPHFASNSSQQTSPMQSMTGPMPQPSQSNMNQMQQFGNPLFDPSDPALFNFDISSLNFGNHYGALEFGMLGQMSSGAAETPPSDTQSIGHIPQSQFGPSVPSPGYHDSHGVQGFTFQQDSMVPDGWKPHSRPGSNGHMHQRQISTNVDGGMRQDGPFPTPAFAIGSAPSRLPSTSPGASHQDIVQGFDNAPVSPAMFVGANQQQPNYGRAPQQPQQSPNMQPQVSIVQPSPRRQRQRDTSAIYDSVKEPYGYTEHFHMLTSFLIRRFSKQKRLRIAKALASVRPSFISCTKNLSNHDLIFAEKCFQRTLVQYEEFLKMQSVPTIICRRTGEVAAASKEFEILTGWPTDVLLGKDTNYNVNAGNGTVENDSQSSSETPSLTGNNPGKNDQSDNGLGKGTASPPTRKPQPVFLAELLDEDSVVRFFEDYSKMAFGDSRGSVMAPCKLIKYRTREQMESQNKRYNDQIGRDSRKSNGHGMPSHLEREQANAKLEPASTIRGESGMNALGDQEGMVESTSCWTVKRDPFEVPMMIILNFLPCI